MSIDPIRLAQFMVLPGASELIEAFAALPPGEVRDSAVSHVQVLARAVGWKGPPDIPMGEPVGALAHHTPPRLASPFAENLTAASVDGQVVERVLRGEAPHVVADDMGLKLGMVARLMAQARRAGVVFPGDDKAGPGAKVSLAKTNAQNAAGRSRKEASAAGVFKQAAQSRWAFRAPVPAPPYWWEDQQSPIWGNPSLLPATSDVGEGSMAGIGPLDSFAFKMMTSSAAKHGLTLRQHIAQRFDILKRVEAGASPTEVADALGLKVPTVYTLLRRVGRTWSGLVLTEGRDKPTPRPPTAAPGETPRQGHERWGFALAIDFENARERVRDLRLRGNTPESVIRQTGLSTDFVKAAIDYWKYHGVEFPRAITPRGQTNDRARA